MTPLPGFDTRAFARESDRKLRAGEPVKAETTTDEARQLLDEERSEEALSLVSRVLDLTPEDAEARRLSDECTTAMEGDCWAVIGSPTTVLRVAVSPDELRAFALDHVCGFLISRVDGVHDVETLLDIAGMPHLVALRHLRGLVSRGIVVERRR